MSTSKDCPFGAGRGSQPAIRFPLFLKAGPPKNTLFWRNRALFPVASRSNPRCSKAQIASYLAQIRRFLAPTAWASSTSTTKKISPQATQAWFFGQWLEKGRGCPWHACGTVGWNNTMTYPWEESSLYISHVPGFKVSPNPSWKSRRPIGKQRAMPGSSWHLPQIPLFLKVAPPKNNLLWRNRAFFPLASRSNPRWSKAQITERSSTSTTKKISPQATQAWFRKGSGRFWTCFFGQWLENGRGCPWHACGTIGWNNTMTCPWAGPSLYISPVPWSWRWVLAPPKIAGGPLQAKGMPGSSWHLPQTPLFLEVAPQKNNLFWRNRAFFPVVSRSNPRCSKAQIASCWAQIGRFLALAPQRMSHLFGKDSVFFGDNVNVFNFWIFWRSQLL